jgi:phage-related protein
MMAGGERTVKIKLVGELSKTVSKAVGGANREIKKLNDNIGKGVGGFADKLKGGLSDAFGAIPGQLKVVGIAAAGVLAAALAPAVGAAVSSGVLLGVGGGALAIGIKRAMQSPAVKAAFEPLKKTAGQILTEFSKPFEGPLVRAAGAVKKALDDIRPAINRIGRALAPVIDDLGPAFAEFLRQAMPGIESAVKASVPLFRILADKLPGIGRAISLFFQKISANSDDTNAFFGDLIDLISNLIIGLGVAIGKLTSWYSNIRNFLTRSADGFREFRVKVINEFGKILDGAAAAFAWVPGVGPKLAQAQAKFSKFRADANRELAAIKDRRVRVEVWSNVGAAAKNVARILRGIKDEKVYISVGSNVGQVVAGINKQIAGIAGKRASGGPVSAGRSYVVGERGPEVITMQGNGVVTPNRDLAGGGDVYEIHVQLADEVTKVIRLTNRDLKRRAGARGATA